MLDAPAPYSPKFTSTPRLMRDLLAIEYARGAIENMHISASEAVRLIHYARLSSTVHSTRIEGNPLDMDGASAAIMRRHGKVNAHEQEVRNYWRALEWMEVQMADERPVSESFIRQLHHIIDPTHRSNSGSGTPYRDGQVWVTNSKTGKPVYGAPEAKDVPAMMRDLVAWGESRSAMELPTVLRAAALSHRFVTIHPFYDGNGRTARALATYALWTGGHRMRGFLSVEEFYSRDLQAYYDAVHGDFPVVCYDLNAKGESRLDGDMTDWMEFFASAMAMACTELMGRAKPLPAGMEDMAAGLGKTAVRTQHLFVRLWDLKQKAKPVEFAALDITEWFGVSAKTARDWLAEWRDEGIVEPSDPGSERVRSWLPSGSLMRLLGP